jgi:putative FmdB family regulatory protein
MPIYEYRCSHCGAQIEVMQKVSDPAPTPCEKCQTANSFERLISHTSFQLKGGGWYSDLYSSVKKDSSATAAPAAAATTSTPAAPASTPASSTGAASSGSGTGSSGGSSSGSSGSSGGSSSGSSGSSGGSSSS